MIAVGGDKMMKQHPSDSRIECVKEYVERSGFYFASNSCQEEDAKCACILNIIQPVDNLLPISKKTQNSKYFYVRASCKTFYELPVGLYRHLIEDVPC